MRIGHGYDVHKLTEGRKLILGGVDIPYEKGLLVHAVMDALLGACAMEDIGHLFPDNDPTYAGADSMKLLETVVSRLRENEFQVGNVDVTVIAQAPKLAPFVPQIKVNLARGLDIAPDRVNVKATTEERLGFTGRGEGISCHAVALVLEKSDG